MITVGAISSWDDVNSPGAGRTGAPGPRLTLRAPGQDT